MTGLSVKEMEAISQTRWDALAKKRIFFGHQSVGFNIIDGLDEIMKDMPSIKLNVKLSEDAEDFEGAVFAHSKIGKNGRPDLKIAEFEKILDTGVGQQADAAFLKLCYIDFTGDADVEKIFSHYTQTMKKIQSKYSKLKLLHVTVPLKVAESGVKARIKKVIGRRLVDNEENIKRNQFNAMMRATYGKSGELFDLAEHESTLSGGGRATFVEDGTEYFGLASEWSDDGGHLNRSGRKRIAKALLLFLAHRFDHTAEIA